MRLQVGVHHCPKLSPLYKPPTPTSLRPSWVLCGKRVEGNNIIEERLDVVEGLVGSGVERRSLHEEVLPRLPDALSLHWRLARLKGSLQDCHKVYQLVKALPRIRRAAQGAGGGRGAVEEGLVEPLLHAEDAFGNFLSLVDEMVDLDHFQETYSYRVKPECDEQLSGNSSHFHI